MSDHERGCEGRNYVCTCGYGDALEARATAAEAREARLLEALRKIEAGEGIGGPDAELQCADIALAAIEENQRGQG